jgi:adenine-specific DNA-methyltransferase
VTEILREPLSAEALPSTFLWQGDVETFLDTAPRSCAFDLVVSSPPYNIGKSYERIAAMDEYTHWQQRVLAKIVARLRDGGSVCWQVGNSVSDNEVLPLDYIFHPMLRGLGLTLRNRIVWTFGHGLHSRRRFSGRYEVVLWYTKGNDYKFNLDAVRVPAKYPSKKQYHGPRKGNYSGNPLGKNPEDVWTFDFDQDVWTNIPNVKSNHVEKTVHPCQFPVGLVERLILALSDPGDIVFDPFAGVASAGVAASLHGRRFWGCELNGGYVSIGKARIDAALGGQALYRPHDVPVYDHRLSGLSQTPNEWSGKDR